MKNKKLGFRSSGVLEFRSSDNSFTDENLHTKVSSELLNSRTPELQKNKQLHLSFFIQ